MSRYGTALLIVTAATLLTSCAKETQEPNRALFINNGPYTDWCWMYAKNCPQLRTPPTKAPSAGPDPIVRRTTYPGRTPPR